VYLLGLDILPRYRRQGLARELLRLYEIWSQVRGKHRMVLTAHKEKVGMYEKMGFTDLGISDSVWGGGVWHEMERRLQ
jgi:ribosomal protein S18 acetylase RimI-like enzyme